MRKKIYEHCLKTWIKFETLNIFENVKFFWKHKTYLGNMTKILKLQTFWKTCTNFKIRNFSKKYSFLKIIKFGIFEFVLQKMNNFGICETFLKKGKQENMNLKKIQNIEKRNRKKMEQKTKKREDKKQTQKKTGIKTKNHFREHSGRFTKPVACPSTHSLMQ